MRKQDQAKFRRILDRVGMYCKLCKIYSEKGEEDNVNLCRIQVHSLAGKIGVESDGNQDTLTKDLAQNCLKKNCSKVLQENIQNLYSMLLQ